VDGSACAPPQPRASRPEGQAKPEAGQEAAALAERLRWTYPYAADVEIPSKLTATQLKGRAVDEEVAEGTREAAGRTEEGAGLRRRNFQRPRFAQEAFGLTPAQKGTALHLVMQFIDFARTGTVEEIRAEIARLVDRAFLTPAQGEAVEPEKVAAFFASGLGRALRTSPTLRREFKFSILVPAAGYYSGAGEGEQVLLQGVVDCFFEEGDGLTVVDFKTDHVFGEDLLRRAEAYRPQLAAYSRALGEITGKPVARQVLWFFSEGRAVEI